MARRNILIGQRKRVRKQNSEKLVRWQLDKNATSLTLITS